VTADYFAIDVDDRIVQTNEFVGPQVEKIFTDAGMRGIIGARYFGNLIDTETRGLDIVVNRASRLGRGDWRITGGFSAVRTRVSRVSAPPEGFSGFDTVLFNRAQQGAIERGQPQRTIVLTNNYRIGPWSFNLHNQRFGEAALLDVRDPADDQTVSAKWLTDLNVSLRVRRDVSVTVAAANLFDAYPDEWNDFPLGVNATGMSNSGIYRYPGGISPFGMNGRTLSMQLSWR
jgi:iron complex outermembrane receptor protein